MSSIKKLKEEIYNYKPHKLFKKQMEGVVNQPVAFHGDETAKAMFIGIAPGKMKKKKKKKGREHAFEHGSGKILQKVINQYEIDREKCFITNVFKTPIPEEDQKLTEDMILSQTKFIKQEVRMVRPQLIYILGNRAQKYWDGYIKNEININAKIKKVWHPAYVARNKNLKKDYFQDFKDLEEINHTDLGDYK